MGDEELIRTAVVRLRARVFALVFGLVSGAGLFLATVYLLLRGGRDVGKHLKLLSNYCPGYDVTWLGAFVGFGYGLVYGAVVGFAVAWIYNRFAERGIGEAETARGG